MKTIKNLPKSKLKITVRTQLVIAGGFLGAGVIAAFFFFGNMGISKSTKAAQGMHGIKTVSAANSILNEYTTLTANAAAGATTITVTSSSLNANGRFASSLLPGELVMIIQMQGATISTADNSGYGSVSSYNNCGRFEFADVLSIPGSTSIRLTAGLKYSYTSAGAVQVIRVPRYSSFTVNATGSVTCPAWDGATGGIVAIESNGASVINGSINVSGLGFRGGLTEQNTNTPGNHSAYRSTNNKDGAEKGESIAGYPPAFSSGSFGRGAPANGGGGGNSHNGGGGGGANAGSGTWNGGGIPDNSNPNYTTAWNLEGGGFASNNSPGGGRGGYTWSNAAMNPLTTAPADPKWIGDERYIMGGFGGRILDYSGGRIFFGGGGGAGDSNNNVGTPGGNGGGIIFLLSGGSVSGSGSINANGANVPLSTSAPSVPGDASGGGGGGGAIIIFTNGSSVSGLTLNANGGTGGSQNLNNGNEAEGAGGGGGGGYISTTNNSGLTRNVNGAANGTTNAPPMTNFPPNGATRGANGLVAIAPPNPYSTPSVLPVTLVSFKATPDGNSVLLKWVTGSEKNNDYFSIMKSGDGINYAKLANVKGAGNSTSPKAYSCTDQTPFNGENYYYLSQTDFDGTTVSFKSIAIHFESENSDADRTLHVFPNPFTDHLKIVVPQETAGKFIFELKDMSGRNLSRHSIEANGESSQMEWTQLGSIPRGNYLLYSRFPDGKTSVTKISKK